MAAFEKIYSFTLTFGFEIFFLKTNKNNNHSLI